MQIRTDLAVEARELYRMKNKNKEADDGIRVETERNEDATVTTVDILNSVGSDKLKKPIGKYITIESMSLKNLDPDSTVRLSYILKKQLRKIIDEENKGSVLVVGLGNRNITPDALGPEVVSEIMVTKHINDYAPELLERKLRAVCAVTPGVMGITGVETKELVLGIVKRIKPSLVIAIDALASGNPERISTTIQITDAGITPGSGIGNRREGINSDTLGIPVVAIGVPTVVDAVSVARITMEKIFSEADEETRNLIGKSHILKKFSGENNHNLMVTPKEIDNIISHISKVISNGINLALHPDIDLEYMENFIF